MPFKKGHQGFKPQGAKSEKTKQWEILGEAITTKHTERFNKIMNECDDDMFVRHFKDILEYFKPKLARTETDITSNGKQISLTPLEFVNKAK